MCELQAQVQLRTSTAFHFEYRFRHSDSPSLTKKPDSSNTGVYISGQNMNDFDPSMKKGQVD